VAFVFREEFGVIDPQMVEACNIEHIVRAQGMGVDNVGHNLALWDRLEAATLHVGGVTLA
jgi:hypothetical protein